MLTRFERARVLSARSLQLALGAPPAVEVPEGVIDSYDVAVEEFNERKIPFIVVREYPNGKEERVEV